MNWKSALIILIIAIAANSLLSWTYKKKTVQDTSGRDTVSVAASNQYAHMTALKWLFLGKNYRTVWSEPVAMPVFHLTTTNGGFIIERLGGGQQTRTLHLINRDGSKWVLRSVDKFVTKQAVPKELPFGFVRSLMQDQISASYPYGLLVVHDLSRALGVPAHSAQLFYVPDDTAFGSYREDFAHLVCMLIPKKVDGVQVETIDTEPLRHAIDSSDHYAVLQKQVLKARLLDMLIGDWDRHNEQWEWQSLDSAGSRYFFPVPEDRDQAFFLSTGLLVGVIRLFGLPQFIGFHQHIRSLKKLNHKVHEFDHFFLNELDKESWKQTIRNFQATMSDEVIAHAVHCLPQEVYAINGQDLEAKLRSRRDDLLVEGLRYYDFLASKVTVRGAREAETFRIDGDQKRTLLQVVRKSDGQKIYERTFFEKETDEILLMMQSDDDLMQSGKSPIRLELSKQDKVIN